MLDGNGVKQGIIVNALNTATTNVFHRQLQQVVHGSSTRTIEEVAVACAVDTGLESSWSCLFQSGLWIGESNHWLEHCAKMSIGHFFKCHIPWTTIICID